MVALNKVLLEQFIASQETIPNELILDIDASDIPLHGDQEGKQFHAYYDSYCFHYRRLIQGAGRRQPLYDQR